MRYLILTTIGLWTLALLPDSAGGQVGSASPLLRDPTQPLEMNNVALAEIAGKLSLNAIIVKPESTVAFINGRPLKRGDTFNGIRITRIDSDRVFYDGEESGVLLLYPEIIKNRRPRESEQ